MAEPQTQAQPQAQPPAQTIAAGQRPVGVREQSGVAAGALPIPAPRPPKRNPVLTRAEMVNVIREGGAVNHKGDVIAHETHLPTEEELAAGDEEKTAQVAAAHEASIAYSQAALARLKAGDATREKVKADADAKTKAEADARAKAGK